MSEQGLEAYVDNIKSSMYPVSSEAPVAQSVSAPYL